ncbi:MAG: hypothetical protein AAFX56_06660 [Pseudomonadota bacterium]
MFRYSLLLAVLCAASGCEPDSGGQPFPTATNDSLLQRAFESCVVDNVKEMRAQNPDLPSSIESSTMTRIHHSCETAVVRTCERNQDTEACQRVLDMYIKLH